jgi:hypothetical protein
VNDGENIVYAAPDVGMVRLPGDRKSTNDANLTTLQRRFGIRKDRKSDALSVLVDGLLASGYSNLRLFGPPLESTDEVYAFFDCIFQGVLSPSEGGRDEAYEYFDKLTNLADVTVGTIPARYVQPVYRYQYTVPKDSPDRNETREIDLPETVSARNTLNGAVISLPASSFFWEFSDLERINYGAWDTIRESWKLSYKFAG